MAAVRIHLSPSGLRLRRRPPTPVPRLGYVSMPAVRDETSLVIARDHLDLPNSEPLQPGITAASRHRRIPTHVRFIATGSSQLRGSLRCVHRSPVSELLLTHSDLLSVDLLPAPNQEPAHTLFLPLSPISQCVDQVESHTTSPCRPDLRTQSDRK